MARKIDIRERIAVRAYYMAIDGVGGSDIERWLSAERIEAALAAKRSDASRRGAMTRRGVGTLRTVSYAKRTA